MQEDWVRRDIPLIERVLLAKTLVSGYNTMITMNNRLPCFFPTASCQHWKRAVEAARRAINVILVIAMPVPSELLIRMVFLLRPFVVVLALFKNLDSACDDEMRCKDLTILSKLRNTFVAMSGSQKHLRPILETMGSLMKQTRACSRNNV